MKKILILAGVIFASSIYAQTPHLPFTRTLTEKGYEIGIDTTYFQTATRVNSEGSEYNLQDGESFNRIDMLFYGSYGFTNNFEMKLDMRVRRNSASFYNGADFVNAESLGLQSGAVTFKYAWPYEAGWQWALEASYRNTFYTNQDYDANTPDDIVLGDDGQEIAIGFGVTYLTKSNNFISARALYRNPDTQLSSEIFLEAEVAFNWKYFSLFGGGETNISLEGDPYAGTSDVRPPMNTGNTLLYNSTNRAWVAGTIGAGLALGEKWRLEVIGKKYVHGNSTDLGDEALIRFARRSESDNKYRNYDSEFKEYRVEAAIEKIAKGEKGVIIDKGLADGVSKGMKFDFFKFDYLGGNILIASGYAIKVTSSKAVVQITSRYQDEKITESTVVRGGVIRN